MIRKGRAVWRGTGKDGTGELTANFGVLANTPYSFKTRFESEPGAKPEELIAAAHAGCFPRWRWPSSSRRQASLRPSWPPRLGLSGEGGPGLPDLEVGADLRAQVPGIERDKFEELARAAEKNCPCPRSSTPRSRWTSPSSKPPRGAFTPHRLQRF